MKFEVRGPASHCSGLFSLGRNLICDLDGGGSSSEKGGLWKKSEKGGGAFWPLLCTFTYYKYIISIMTNTFNQLAVLHVCNNASSQRLVEIFYLARGKSEVWRGNIDYGLFSRGSGGLYQNAPRRAPSNKLMAHEGCLTSTFRLSYPFNTLLDLVSSNYRWMPS